MPEDHDLHIGAADVANHIGIREGVEGRLGMGHRLDHPDIGAENVFQEILAIAGERQSRHIVDAAGFKIAEERLGILDRVPFGLRIGGVEHFLVGRERHRFGSGAAEIASDEDRPV